MKDHNWRNQAIIRFDPDILSFQMPLFIATTA
jgi:hypothetical protein